MKEKYIKIAKELYTSSSLNIFLKQIDIFFNSDTEEVTHNYKVGDRVYLKKGTLIHGTFQNYEGIKKIKETGLIASDMTKSRKSKFPAAVGVWNLKKAYYLKDYIDFYSGGTIKMMNQDGSKVQTEVIPFSKMNKLMTKIQKSNIFRWYIEQTKEARFLPSLVQNDVQTAVIYKTHNKYLDLLKEQDLMSDKISNKAAKQFINEVFYEGYVNGRKNKDDFFTDRESAIIFGLPSNYIEGILVGRKYEKDSKMLDKIKKLYKNAYICNLDGIVIRK